MPSERLRRTDYTLRDRVSEFLVRMTVVTTILESELLEALHFGREPQIAVFDLRIAPYYEMGQAVELRKLSEARDRPTVLYDETLKVVAGCKGFEIADPLARVERCHPESGVFFNVSQ